MAVLDFGGVYVHRRTRSDRPDRTRSDRRLTVRQPTGERFVVFALGSGVGVLPRSTRPADETCVQPVDGST
ncbi:hypothetical protein BRC68_17590 [Halobacteriales archaeon QH_6_64_20]|nr:MAG: hypothetical protein BRC68_17590 [Halobacteriales archaeon QH_6_64_20]